MKLNHFTAIEVSIATGVVVENAITWGVKVSKENAKRECMGYGSSYFYYLEEVKKSYNYKKFRLNGSGSKSFKKILSCKSLFFEPNKYLTLTKWPRE